MTDFALIEKECQEILDNPNIRASVRDAAVEVRRHAQARVMPPSGAVSVLYDHINAMQRQNRWGK